MIEYTTIDVIKKLALIITISIAIAGTMLASEIMFSKTQVSNTNVEENIQIAKEDLSVNEKAIASTKTTSRSSTEIRNSAKSNENEATTEQVNKENEEKATEKSNNSDEKKEASIVKKESSKNEEENSEKNNEKENDESEETEEQESKKSTAKTISISEVKISKSMDLTKRTGLSREDFIKLMSRVRADTSGFFEDNAGEIYDLCEKYSINEIFFCGLISAESGWNIASNHRNTHNYISLMSSKGLIRFGSVEEGLEKAAETLHNKYLTPGGSFYYGPTLSAMKTRFCPASSTWVSLVYGRMSQIVK